MKELFFEDPTWLYVGLSVLLLVQLALWRRSRTRWALASLAIPVVLAGAVFALSSIVQTDREQVIAATEQIEQAFNDGRYEDILDHLDDQFESSLPWGDSGKALVESAGDGVQRAGIQSASVTKIRVDVTGLFAESVVNVLVETRLGNVPTVWTLQWVKIDDTWKIRAVTRYRLGLTG